jgi:hypothetical protein
MLEDGTYYIDIAINQLKKAYRCENIAILIDEQPDDVMHVFIKCKKGLKQDKYEASEKIQNSNSSYVNE